MSVDRYVIFVLLIIYEKLKYIFSTLGHYIYGTAESYHVFFATCGLYINTKQREQYMIITNIIFTCR